MKFIHAFNWTKISLINFLIVSFFGLLMRYKIGFEFPYLNQKNLQHAHSHFAFLGWVSLLLMVLLVYIIRKRLSEKEVQRFNYLFFSLLICAYALLVSFTIDGYGITSIVLSTVSIFISFAFSGMYFNSLRKMADLKAKKWLIAALFYLVLSSLGTFYLSYITATHQMTESSYLASIYWYLHFQYNGWFFFACAGLFVNYLQERNCLPTSINSIFWWFALSCLPGYGLSVLWFDLPLWVYILVCAAAVLQFFAILKFLIDFKKIKPFQLLQWNPLTKFLMLFIGFSLFLKLLLQLGSTVPAIEQFAFGFRPIVIAYLHLVLLAFTSLFLVTFVYINGILHFGKWAIRGLFLLSIGILLNEFVLALQGIASLSYTPIPYANEMLFGIALLIFISLILVSTAKRNKQ